MNKITETLYAVATAAQQLLEASENVYVPEGTPGREELEAAEAKMHDVLEAAYGIADKDAFEYYDVAAHREPAPGPPRKRD